MRLWEDTLSDGIRWTQACSIQRSPGQNEFLLFTLSSLYRMASKATITLMLLGTLSQRSLAAPARDDNLDMELLGPAANSMIKGSQYFVSFPRLMVKPQTGSATTRVYELETPSFKPSSTTSPKGGTKPLFSFSYSRSNPFTQTITSTPDATTATVTDEIQTTIIVNPATVTGIFFPTPSISTSNSPSRTSTAGLGPAKSIWLAPTDLSDLSAFHVSKFTGGQGNLEFVNSVPAKAKRPDELVPSDDQKKNTLRSTTLLQLLFPAGSINPGTKPQGGAEFYASPINIASARNVTLRYSVFFPLGFDFVLGGKMPGLYGGHTGCSGGDPAVDCFSTRLMWREGGIGELYLVSFSRVFDNGNSNFIEKYASKNRQSDKLCRAEGSVCDEMYGFSIGRGSFSWKGGDWTTIRQTVSLNTPGKQDGGFTLDVNGKRVISRSDILYRDEVEKAEKGSRKGKDVKKKTATKHTETRPLVATPKATPPSSSTDGGDLLGIGPLLSSLLGGLRREIKPAERGDNGLMSPVTTTTSEADSLSSPSPALPTRTQVFESSSQEILSRIDFEMESTKGGHGDVKFVGIFFRFVCESYQSYTELIICPKHVFRRS